MSPFDKTLIIVFALYAVVFLIVYRRLIPRLSPPGRFLATVMLAVQVLALAMALILHPADFNSIKGEWHRQLWSLDRETNIPSTIATTQLALVGLVAALTAWFARTQSTWQRLYWVGIALLFLLLAREEFLQERQFLSEDIFGLNGWVISYALVGAVVVGATAFIAVRSPQQSRIWHICLLAGLALGALGAGFIEVITLAGKCSILGFDGPVRCWLFMPEEVLEKLGIWLILVAVLGQLSIAAPTPRLGLRLTILVLPALIVGVVIASSPVLTQRLKGLPFELEFFFHAPPPYVEYASDVDLRGYRLDYGEHSLGAQLVAVVTNWDAYIGLGYSLHLVDQATGESVAGTDASASRQQSFKFGKYHLFIQRIDVEIPPGTERNRALWVVLTTWREVNNTFIPQFINSSDMTLLDETQVILGELALPVESADIALESLALFDNGSEFGIVQLPPNARQGDTLEIEMTWSATKGITEDYIQFLHFGHKESGEWWVYDQQPLGVRLPTRLWRSGLFDSEIWRIALPADLAPGKYHVFTGLYRSGDQERVAVRDMAGTLYTDARVPLGMLTVANT